VVAAFALYPFLYAGLTALAPAPFTTLLPGLPVMVTVLAFGLFAASFDFVSGYTGYLSFGHAAFFGIGGYTVVLAANDKLPLVPPETPFLLLLVLGGLLAALAAVAVGLVSFRLSGVYFAMITLGFSQVLYVLVRNWDYVGSNPRTGASVSIRTHPEGFRVGVPFVSDLSLRIGRLTGDSLAVGPVALGPTEVSYLLVGAVVLVSYLAMQRAVHSPFGRAMVAVRENEARARAVGYDTYRFEVAAFAISAFFAAVAGGLLAGFERSVSPEGYLFFLVAGNALLAAIIGGFGTLAGPLYGWLFFETLTEFLESNVSRGVPDGLLPLLRATLGEGALAVGVGGLTVEAVLETLFAGRASLYVGLVFVLFVLYVPDGFLGTLRRWVGGRFLDCHRD
jgi:branched-chain amino acid transport system permease protein